MGYRAKRYSFSLALESSFLRISTSKHFASANCSIVGGPIKLSESCTSSLNKDSSDLSISLCDIFACVPYLRRSSLTCDLAEDQGKTEGMAPVFKSFLCPVRLIL